MKVGDLIIISCTPAWGLAGCASHRATCSCRRQVGIVLEVKESKPLFDSRAQAAVLAYTSGHYGGMDWFLESEFELLSKIPAGKINAKNENKY